MSGTIVRLEPLRLTIGGSTMLAVFALLLGLAVTLLAAGLALPGWLLLLVAGAIAVVDTVLVCWRQMDIELRELRLIIDEDDSDCEGDES